MTARLIIGDARQVLATLPENSVDLVVTSPPFLALRSYLPADHPDKDSEMGSEGSPGAFIDALLDVTEALDRVLAPHGSICIELGDTYSGAGGSSSGDWSDSPATTKARVKGGDTAGPTGANRGGMNGRASWPTDKSLCLIPEIYRFALVYGFNPLTGRKTPRWRVRNVVRWHRPNPPVGALGDKFRPATSEMVVACKSRTRYFDLDAVRTKDGPGGNETRRSSLNRSAPGEHTQDARDLVVLDNPNGAPPLDTWIIPTAPYKGSHYATFPPDLVVVPTASMCPERVCVKCGEPSRRLMYIPETEDDGRTRDPIRTDCGHDAWRPGVVLDPFAGSGTTLSVATGHGRDAIGIDLDERNADLCRDRIGMFLEVVL